MQYINIKVAEPKNSHFSRFLSKKGVSKKINAFINYGIMAHGGTELLVFEVGWPPCHHHNF